MLVFGPGYSGAHRIPLNASCGDTCDCPLTVSIRGMTPTERSGVYIRKVSITLRGGDPCSKRSSHCSCLWSHPWINTFPRPSTALCWNSIRQRSHTGSHTPLRSFKQMRLFHNTRRDRGGKRASEALSRSRRTGIVPSEASLGLFEHWNPCLSLIA